MSHTVLHFPDIRGQCQKTVGTARQGRNIVSLLSQGQASGASPLPVLSLSPLCRQDLPFLKKREESTPLPFHGFLSLEPLIYPLIKRGAPGCNIGVKGQKKEMDHPRSGKGAMGARDRGHNYISVSFR